MMLEKFPLEKPSNLVWLDTLQNAIHCSEMLIVYVEENIETEMRQNLIRNRLFKGK